MREAVQPLHVPLVTEAVAVRDVDDFVSDMYNYYYRRGWSSICVCEIANTFRCACVLALSGVMVCAADWSAILSRCEPSTCGPISVFKTLGWFGYIVWTLVIALSAARMAVAVSRITAYKKIGHIYDQMKLTDAELRVTAWSDILCAFRRINDTRRYLHIDLDDLSVARRITRQDNILIALLGADILPSWCADMTFVHHLIRAWLNLVVMDSGANRIRNLNSASIIVLSRRLGVFLTVISPLVCVVLVCWTMVGHADDIRRRTAPSLLEREFTPAARVKHRGFNELMHEHDERLDAARPLAARCADHFPTPISDALTSVIHTAAASMMVFLIVLTLCNDDILLYGRVWNQPVLWMLGLSSVIVSVTPSRRHDRASVSELRTVLRGFVQHMRATPPAWSVVGADALYDVRQLYRPALSIACIEVAGCVAVPWLLLFEVRRCANPVASFISSHLCQAPNGAGVMCDFSLRENVPRPEPHVDEDALVTAYLEASDLHAPIVTEDLRLSDVADASSSW